MDHDHPSPENLVVPSFLSLNSAPRGRRCVCGWRKACMMKRWSLHHLCSRRSAAKIWVFIANSFRSNLRLPIHAATPSDTNWLATTSITTMATEIPTGEYAAYCPGFKRKERTSRHRENLNQGKRSIDRGAVQVYSSKRWSPLIKHYSYKGAPDQPWFHREFNSRWHLFLSVQHETVWVCIGQCTSYSMKIREMAKHFYERV